VAVETYALSQEERELIDEGLGSRIVSVDELQTFRRRHAAMKVRFRAKALDDIACIFLFRSSRHSREVAARVEAAIFASTKLLGRHPELGTRDRS